MKRVYNIIVLNIVAVMMTACHFAAPEPEGELKANYTGTVEVDNDSEHFVKEGVEVSVTKEENSDTYTIKMFRVKFATAMPVELDILIQGVSINEDGIISGDEIIPYAMGGPYEKYKITGLTGTMTSDRLQFEMVCGKYPTQYSGTR